MSSVNGQIQSISNADRNTKYGLKKIHYIHVNGNRYQLGFGKVEVAVGQTVQFEETDKGYGPEVVKGSLMVIGVPTAAAGAGSAPTAKAPDAAPSKPTPKNSGVFPIPALSGERAIIRQNALTQARELVVGIIGQTKPTEQEWKGRQQQFDTLVDEILRLAPKFEAYSAGDTDAAEAKAEVAKGI